MVERIDYSSDDEYQQALMYEQWAYEQWAYEQWAYEQWAYEQLRSKKMVLSEIINILQDAKDKHGDIPLICTIDQDWYNVENALEFLDENGVIQEFALILEEYDGILSDGLDLPEV